MFQEHVKNEIDPWQQWDRDKEVTINPSWKLNEFAILEKRTEEIQRSVKFAYADVDPSLDIMPAIEREIQYSFKIKFPKLCTVL